MTERKPSANVEVRPYLDADQLGVEWLFLRTPPWGRTYPRPQPVPEELLTPAMSFPDGAWVAVEQDMAGEAVVGFCAMSWQRQEPDLPDFVLLSMPTMRINWVSVAAERWRLGIGRRLTQTAIDRALELGAKEIILETGESQEGAIALYEAIGFRVTGRYVNGRWHQVWMSLTV